MLEEESGPESVSPIEYDDEDSTVTTPSPQVRLLPKPTGLTPESIPTRIHRVQYCIRGAIAQRATELQNSTSPKPYKKLLPCHCGNPMLLGMTPLSYVRETVALCGCPSLLEKPEDELCQLFHPDSIARARRYIAGLGSPGAYTESLGAQVIREDVTEFLEHRDGTQFGRPDPESVMLTNGASEAISTILTCLIGGEQDGVLCPVPQYPLYNALICKLGGSVLPYYLAEEPYWTINLGEVEKQFNLAIARGITVKALVVICPGNPVPTYLPRPAIVEVLKFAAARNILIIADEVYQANCYDPTKPFIPFRKVLLEEQLTTQLASLHSSSKGLSGECGFRGGFVQFENIPQSARAIVAKMRSVELCSNTMGQCVMGCIAKPPTPDQESYKQYYTEKQTTFNDLKTKAQMITEFFNSLPNCSCQAVLSALYAFPKIEFPLSALQAAAAKGVSVELMYCLELLEATGIVVSNGDGFGQLPNTHHIRFAILPQIDDLVEGLVRYKEFHIQFFRKYQ